jgi:Tol biopolymer transport system component
MEGMAWSPDGGSVLFSATINGSEYVVRQVDMEGRVLPTRQNVGMVVIHDIAPDGAWAVTRDDYPIHLLFRAAGSTAEADISWLDGSIYPILSGDGKTLLFTDQSLAAGPNYAVTLRPTAGGSIVRLGEGMGRQFSSDGKRVLAIVPSTPPRVVSYPVGAGDAAQLDRGNFEKLSRTFWLPDGRLLVSGNEPGQPPRCFLLDPVSGATEPVGPEGIWEGMPSPDGSVFAARNQAGWSIYPISGSAEGKPVPSLDQTHNLIRWSPDGKALYCFQRSSIPAAVDRVDIATGRHDTIATLGENARAGLVSILSVSLADDLRTLVYGGWNYTSVLYTVAPAQ